MRYREAYLWVGVPIAIFCVWVLFLYLPLATEIDDKKRQLTEVETQLEKIETELALPKESATDGNRNAILNSVPNQIPHLEAFPDFMRRIASSIRRSGVTITRLDGRFDDGHTGVKSALAYPVTEIDFTGRFMDIGLALEQIQGIKAYRRIVKARLATQADGYPALKGSVEIEFKAWRDYP